MADEKFEDIEDMDIDGSNDEPVEDEDNDVDNIEVDEDVPSEEPVEDDATETEPNVSEEELFAQLNELFLPVVRMQDAEEPVQESTVVMEKNVFRLDDASKVAQLLSLCAMLIARAKDTEAYKTYIRASEERRNAKIDIQNAEASEARALAAKYLNTLSANNDDEGARAVGVSLLKEM
jgi:hypothetical protein